MPTYLLLSLKIRKFSTQLKQSIEKIEDHRADDKIVGFAMQKRNGFNKNNNIFILNGYHNSIGILRVKPTVLFIQAMQISLQFTTKFSKQSVWRIFKDSPQNCMYLLA